MHFLPFATLTYHLEQAGGMCEFSEGHWTKVVLLRPSMSLLINKIACSGIEQQPCQTVVILRKIRPQN